MRPPTADRRMEGATVEDRCCRAIVLLLIAALMLPATAALAGSDAAKQAEEQMKFGFKAARRGYWQEALERFVTADKLTPGKARILNNIAVALEANGRFDEARDVYRRALAADPGNRAVKKNLQRFEEFVERFVTDDRDDDGTGAGKGGDDAD